MVHRIDTSTAGADVNGPGRKGFINGNATTATPPTRFSAAWCNDIQENLCRVIEAAGIVLVKGDYGQLTAAIQFLIAAGGAAFHTATDTGAVNACAAALVPVPTSYSNMVLALKILNSNTGVATFNANGLGAKTIKKMSSGSLVDVAAGDLPAGAIVLLAYDGTYFQVVGGVGAGIGESYTDLGSGTSLVLDGNGKGALKLTMAGTTAISSANLTAGKVYSFLIRLHQDATGSRAFTLPANTKWPYGEVPQWPTAANAWSKFVMETWDGGATWEAAFIGASYA